MDISHLFTIIIAAIFINNFVLAKFLGLCSVVAISKRIETAVGMGLSVVFVSACASLITWPIYRFVLIPYEIAYLRIVVFILVIAVFVQLVEMVIRKVNIILYRNLGIYLPLITCNCMILAVAFINVEKDFTLVESIVHGAAAGVGYTLALVLLTGIRERLTLAKVPKAFQGVAMAFIIAGLLSLSFLGFAGLIAE